MERKFSRGLQIALCVGLLAVVPSQAVDVWLYKISKGIHYQQSSGGAPTVLTNNGYVFQANVFLTAPGTVTGASVVSSEGTVRTLTFDDDDELEFRNRVNSKSTLETRYPDGNFTLTVNAVNDGRRVLSLPLLGNIYPNAPFIHNVAALQALNANGYIIISWDALAGGTEVDFIQLRIEDSSGELVWETPDLGEPGALDGTATFALIKAGTLNPNTRYEATVLFEKSCGLDYSSYPGSFGWSTYHARTEFTIATSGVAAPDVESYELAKGRHFIQTNSSPPAPDPGDEFVFSAEVQARAPSAVLSASLTTAGSSTIPLEADSDREEFDYSDEANSQGLLDTKYPPGTYVFHVQTATQGTRSIGLSLPAAPYPPAPRVYFDSSQKIKPDQPLHITWDAWPGGAEHDFVQLRIEDNDGDNVFETDDFDDADALDGRAAGCVIPAGTFQAGKKYEARLTFRRFARLDAASYAGALGMVSYYGRTKFEIETVPPDVKEFQVAKGRVYVQSSFSTVAPTGYVFTARVKAESDQSVNAAAVVTPNGRTVPLVQQADGEIFRLMDVRTSQSALDQDYPEGNYVLAVSTVHDGPRNITLALTGGAYPAAPRLSNYDDAGRINAAVNAELQWESFSGGTERDFIKVEIEEADGDEVFDTDGFGDDDALNGLARNIVIPANTLSAGRVYRTELCFEKVLWVEKTAYAVAEGRAGYFACSFATIATVGAGNPPALQNYHVLSDGRAQFSVTTLNGGTYIIQGSLDMHNWSTIGIISAMDNRIWFTAPPMPAGPCYFYRAVLTR